MKTTDITKIIEANPQTIFSHTSHRSYFMIEGFTYTKTAKYSNATPTKVAIARSVVIRIDGNGEGTISISDTTNHYTLTQVAGNVWNTPEEMRKAQIKSRILEQATEAKRAANRTAITEMTECFTKAFAHHEIPTTYTTIRDLSNGMLALTLTVEQAQALLNIIEG